MRAKKVNHCVDCGLIIQRSSFRCRQCDRAQRAAEAVTPIVKCAGCGKLLTTGGSTCFDCYTRSLSVNHANKATAWRMENGVFVREVGDGVGNP